MVALSASSCKTKFVWESKFQSWHVTMELSSNNAHGFEFHALKYLQVIAFPLVFKDPLTMVMVPPFIPIPTLSESNNCQLPVPSNEMPEVELELTSCNPAGSIIFPKEVDLKAIPPAASQIMFGLKVHEP